MLIDTHVHIFPDAIAERALSRLAAAAHKQPSTDGTLDGTLRKMDEWGVDKIFMMSIATSAHQVSSVNRFAAGCKSERVEPFASVYPLSDVALDDVKAIEDAGFRGVKLHPEYQRFEVADERIFPVYEELQKANLTVVFHAGHDCAYPGSRLASPKSIAKVAVAFPHLKIVSAHLGGSDCNDEALRYEAGLPNVWFDTAYLSGHVDDKTLRAIFAKHPLERVMFATDCPWSSPDVELDLLSPLPLSDVEREQILHLNAEKILDLQL